MNIYKLNQGSTFENLKHFIYLTNEYGVPSAEFVDDFIEQFGLVILNDNFTSEKIPIQSLELFWQDIKDECTKNNIEYRDCYGSLFYEIIGQKALIKIKDSCGGDNWKQLKTEDKLALLKQFILDFKLYISEGIDIVNIDTEIETQTVDIEEECIKAKDINIIYKKSLQYRQSPITIYNNNTAIELYHSINKNSETEYKYIVTKSNIDKLIGTEYTDINKMLNGINISLDYFTNFKYGNNAPIMDLIKHID